MPHAKNMSNSGRRQRRRVIDAVADHCRRVLALFEQRRHFIRRLTFRQDGIKVERSSNGFRSVCLITCNHDDARYASGP